jgi:hypothetical protein
MLSYHQGFDLMELFRTLDVEGKGYATAEDFEKYFG